MSRVLIVDDEPPVGEALVALLEQAGHTARLLTDPRLALAAVEQWAPTVVLLDVMMPGLNGFQVLARLRQGHPTLPVWLMSAYLSDQIDASLLLGARGFLPKPWVLDDVLAAVAGV